MSVSSVQHTSRTITATVSQFRPTNMTQKSSKVS